MRITQSPKNTPQFSLVIKAPLNEVWHALRDKEALLQWHGWDTPALEEEIENIYFTNIREEDSDNTRTLVVNGGDTFILTSEEGKTRLTLVRADLSGDAEWDAYYGNISEGWLSFIEQLRFMLERTPKAQRKTIFVSKTYDREKTVAQLDLDREEEGVPFQGRFEGAELSGEVWFSTPNQLGLVINEWGPGLLILQFSEQGSIATTYNASA